MECAATVFFIISQPRKIFNKIFNFIKNFARARARYLYNICLHVRKADDLVLRHHFFAASGMMRNA